MVNSIAAEAKRTVLHRCIDRRLRWWASIDDNKQKGTLPSYYPVRRAGTAVQERKAGKGQKGAAKSTQETGAKEQRFRAARKARNGKVGLGLLVRHEASSDCESIAEDSRYNPRNCLSSPDLKAMSAHSRAQALFFALFSLGETKYN
jgi:hypothetical protein